MADIDTAPMWDALDIQSPQKLFDAPVSLPQISIYKEPYEQLNVEQKNHIFSKISGDETIVFKVPSEKRRTSLASVACAVVGVLGFGAIWSLPKYEKNHHLPSTTNIGKEFCFTPDAAHHEDGVTQPYKAQIEVCVQDLQTTGPITVFDNPRDVNAELIATWFRSNNTGEFTAASNVEEDLGASPDADVTQIRQVIKAAYLKGYIRAGEANAVRLVLPLSGNFPVFKNVLTDYSIIKVPETKNSPTDITITPVLTP